MEFAAIRCVQVNSFIVCSIRWLENANLNLNNSKRFFFVPLFHPLTYKHCGNFKVETIHSIYIPSYDPLKADNFISETEHF